VTRAAVALGSNLEDPEAQVSRGFDDLAAIADTEALDPESSGEDFEPLARPGLFAALGTKMGFGLKR